MYKILINLALLALFFSSSLKAQLRLSGHVKDKASGEPLIGAIVRNAQSNIFAVTDNAGIFVINVPSETKVLYAEYLGYLTDSLAINQNNKLYFKLNSGLVLNTIEVIANQDSLEIRKPQTGRHELNMELAKASPMVLGESDIMKSLQFLPGIKATMEGGASFSVRGGSPDQNLIIYDGTPIYNSNHAFGLFSVFATETIKKVVVYKSGFPAKWGERLSSVIDVSMKDGNMQNYHAQASLSNIAGSVFYEGPIVKNKVSLVVSGRRSFVDAFFAGSRSAPILFFYDFSSKATWNVNDKVKLSLGFYNGADKIQYREVDQIPNDVSETRTSLNGLSWGNILAQFKGNILHKNNSFSNFSLFYSRYQFNFSSTDSTSKSDLGTLVRTDFNDFNYNSLVSDIGLRYNWTKSLGTRHLVELGGGAIYHYFTPDSYSQVKRENGKAISSSLINNQAAGFEGYLYAQDDWQIHPNVSANIGLRGSVFKNDSSGFFVNIEPRATVSWALGQNQAIKGSAILVHQYVHLLAVSGLSLPIDAWVPVTDKIKPGKSYQFDLSYEKLMKKGFKFSSSAYYKLLYDNIDQNPNESFANFKNWETKVAITDGNAYGLEFFIEKNRGKLTGSLGYTLAWTNRKFQNEQLNNNQVYRYRYDRRHDLSLLLRWQIGNKTKSNGKVVKKYITTAFTFATGNLFTMPTGTITTIDQQNPTYFQTVSQTSLSNSYYLSNINNIEAPSSHRLDLAYVFEKQNKKTKITWSFGLYNAYNNVNTFSLKVGNNQYTNKKVVKQYGTIPVLPFISFKIDFNSSTPTN